MHRFFGQILHGDGGARGQRRNGGVIEVDQIPGHRKLFPVLAPNWLRCDGYRAHGLIGIQFETHKEHYTFKV